MKYSKVDGHSNLIRDEETKAILNTNMTDYNAYMAQKRIKEKENQKLQNLEKDFVNMKDDLNEIKSLLRSLIDGTK
jgi:peroxiredoxin family protein